MFTKSDVEKYFIAEKQESLLFMVVGAVAIAGAVVFLFYHRSSFSKGFAVPLVLIGMLQFGIGFTVYKRSDVQRTDIVYAMDMDPAALRKAEVPRMERVMKGFVRIRYMEMVLACAGILLAFLFRSDPTRLFWFAFGMALIIQAVISLVMDFFAEKRGIVYLEGLRQFLKI